MVPLQTPGKSSHSPSPVMTHHHPHLPPLPTQALLGSLASGAHYAGALPSHSDDPPLHARVWRARSRDRSSEDPSIELKYREVMEDLQKVRVAVVYRKLEEVLTGGLGACPVQLYSCQPTREIIQRRFREDAALEHPLFKCAGIHHVTAVLFALVRILSASRYSASGLK